VPTEVIKTRMQTSTYGISAQTSFAAARRTFASDGWRGFYRGFGITIMREVFLLVLKLLYSDFSFFLQ